LKALITGGTGFIGAQVAADLIDQGADKPMLFDINPDLERLGPIGDQVEVVRGDLGIFSHVLDAVKRAAPDVIYHLGGMLSLPSDADPAAAFQANAAGSFHVLEAARLFAVPQVILASTVATYGSDITDDAFGDRTLQRPGGFYGITKVMAEHMGRFYARKYGLDFRGLRYPSVVGPGVKTMAMVQYNAWVIEECAKGNPFTIWVTPETRTAILYYRDAARALTELAAAPIGNMQTGIYVLDGPKPMPSAAELADRVRAAIPGARIDFKPDREIMELVGKMRLPIDDSRARQEWGWRHEYDLDAIIAAMIKDVRGNG
jgi:threonine 3-dehydrogenase